MNSPNLYRLEEIFGTYYGLLSTQTAEDDSNALDKDADHCPDTFSYKGGSIISEKRTLPYKIDVKKDAEGKVTDRKEYFYFYNSTNIMDKPSRATVITRDQAARIRQVIRDCPLRRQGIE